MSMCLSPTEDSGYHGLSTYPQLATLYEYCHTPLPREVSTVHNFVGREQLEVKDVKLFWTMSLVSLPLADFSLYPSPVKIPSP